MPAHSFLTEHRIECGHECPRYVVPLVFPAPGAELSFPFIFDTGADVSLFPLTWATHLRLQYEQDVLLEAAPRTLAGPLTGHTGLIQARLRVGDIDVPFPLPCFFYHTSAPPPAPAGPPRRRTANPPATDLDDWESRTADASGGPFAPPPGSARGILGRVGFLSRFRVLTHHDRFVVATDDESLRGVLGRSAPRRRR